MKSKKAKEFEQLMQEIDTLQRKIFSQEEEFRLQNETLMQELGSVSHDVLMMTFLTLYDDFLPF